MERELVLSWRRDKKFEQTDAELRIVDWRLGDGFSENRQETLYIYHPTFDDLGTVNGV